MLTRIKQWLGQRKPRLNKVTVGKDDIVILYVGCGDLSGEKVYEYVKRVRISISERAKNFDKQLIIIPQKNSWETEFVVFHMNK